MTAPAVLGIDAAWTERNPSGVALIAQDGARWRAVTVASSYRAFIDDDTIDGRPRADRLLASARHHLDGAGEVQVVCVDMPLATVPIRARRAADGAVSSAYGTKGCAVHSPTETRPGALAEQIRDGFAAAGFSLGCATTRAGATPSVLEVYPHPALLALCGADYRLEYKVSRARRYWPEATPIERRELLLRTWREIAGALASQIDDIRLDLPPVDAPTGALKAFEDSLDALVCAWVGARYLAGAARAFGDATAAIWIPD